MVSEWNGLRRVVLDLLLQLDYLASVVYAKSGNVWHCNYASPFHGVSWQVTLRPQPPNEQTLVDETPKGWLLFRHCSVPMSSVLCVLLVQHPCAAIHVWWYVSYDTHLIHYVMVRTSISSLSICSITGTRIPNTIPIVCLHVVPTLRQFSFARCQHRRKLSMSSFDADESRCIDTCRLLWTAGTRFGSKMVRLFVGIIY